MAPTRIRRAAAGAVAALSTLVIIVPASPAHAAADPTSATHAIPADPGAVLLAVNDLGTVITGLQNWIMGILAAVATLFLVIGGLRYVTAGGDPSEVERAKGVLKSAAIGYALAVLAPVLMSALKGILGV